MKTIFSFFTLLLFFAPLQAAIKAKPLSLTSIQVTDQNGLTQTIQTKERLKEFEKVNFFSPQPYQKIFRTFSRNKAGKVRSIVTTYWPNGQVQQCLDIVDAVAFGRLLEWHESGSFKLKARVVGGSGDLNPSAVTSWLFDGLAASWDEKGNKLAEISYEKGSLQGASTYYYPCGGIKKRAWFLQGKLQGMVEIYYENGTLKEEACYKDGLREGESSLFFSSGAKQGEEFFLSGKLWSGSYYSLEGKLLSQIEEGNGVRAVFEKDRLIALEEIQGGVQQGNVQFFDKQGKLSCQFFLYQQIKHGPEDIYYPGSSQKHLSIDWYEGRIQGSVRTWYPNGKVESEKEYSQNKKNGLSTAWYEDGSLMLIEEFENDALLKGKYFKKGVSHTTSEVEEGKGVATIFDAKGMLIRRIDYEHGKPVVK